MSKGVKQSDEYINNLKVPTPEQLTNAILGISLNKRVCLEIGPPKRDYLKA